MNTDKNQFIQLALQQKALQFGNFTLKSGRQSPYFFNMGVFQTGETLAKLGAFYASILQAKAPPFDVLFGPAYKGIPLACTTAIHLATQFNRPTPYCFNRKEPKDHGEKGSLVGAPLQGNVLIIDDVITAGTAIQEAINLIKQAQAKLAGIVVAFDRQELTTTPPQTTLEALHEQYQVPILSLVSLEDVLAYLKKNKYPAELINQIKSHQAKNQL